MTLRRRLFISNIIMIVLPILMVWVLMLGASIVLFGMRGMPFDMDPVERERMLEEWHGNGRGIIVWCAVMALAIAVTVGVNQFLTRSIIKRVMKPLDRLASVARLFSANNLGVRLDYRETDEFRPVCDTFNEMAARLEAMIEERQKNENSRRELIAGISHDLRTPLTSIKMSVDGIKSGVASSNEQRQKYLDIIENKTGDLEHIIDQLFLFSKLDMSPEGDGEFPAPRQLVDCGAMIEDCVEELSGEYERRGLDLIAPPAPRNLYVSIDPVLFRRVILNIVENALHYKTAERGQITIGCRECAGCEHGGTGVKTVEIKLADNGPGVAPEHLKKLFDVFYRADRSRNTKGSGLGLAISAKIIAKMNGTIHAELPPLGGLAIVIRLPAVSVTEKDNGHAE